VVVSESVVVVVVVMEKHLLFHLIRWVVVRL
jgi:hypothetical protein